MPYIRISHAITVPRDIDAFDDIEAISGHYSFRHAAYAFAVYICLTRRIWMRSTAAAVLRQMPRAVLFFQAFTAVRPRSSR